MFISHGGSLCLIPATEEVLPGLHHFFAAKTSVLSPALPPWTPRFLRGFWSPGFGENMVSPVG